jgi:hypothetical protein
VPPQHDPSMRPPLPAPTLHWQACHRVDSPPEHHRAATARQPSLDRLPYGHTTAGAALSREPAPAAFGAHSATPAVSHRGAQWGPIGRLSLAFRWTPRATLFDGCETRFHTLPVASHLPPAARSRSTGAYKWRRWPCLGAAAAPAVSPPCWAVSRARRRRRLGPRVPLRPGKRPTAALAEAGTAGARVGDKAGARLPSLP